MAQHFRWQNPHDWLLEQARTWSRQRLFEEFHALAEKLSADDIQDAYQDEMDDDGYFEPLPEEVDA